MPRKNRPPKYRLHKARNCGVVTIDGKQHYLWPYGSPESHEKYSRLIAEWSHRSVPCKARRLAPPVTPEELTINELILRYLAMPSCTIESTANPPMSSTTSAVRFDR